MTSTFNSLGIDNLRFFTGDGHEIIMQKIFSARWEIIPNDRVFSAFYKNPYGHFELSPKKDLSYLMDDEHAMPDGNFTLSGAVDMSDNYQYDVEVTAVAGQKLISLQDEFGQELGTVISNADGTVSLTVVKISSTEVQILTDADIRISEITSSRIDKFTVRIPNNGICTLSETSNKCQVVVDEPGIIRPSITFARHAHDRDFIHSFKNVHSVANVCTDNGPDSGYKEITQIDSQSWSIDNVFDIIFFGYKCISDGESVYDTNILRLTLNDGQNSVVEDYNLLDFLRCSAETSFDENLKVFTQYISPEKDIETFDELINTGTTATENLYGITSALLCEVQMSEYNQYDKVLLKNLETGVEYARTKSFTDAQILRLTLSIFNDQGFTPEYWDDEYIVSIVRSKTAADTAALTILNFTLYGENVEQTMYKTVARYTVEYNIPESQYPYVRYFGEVYQKRASAGIMDAQTIIVVTDNGTDKPVRYTYPEIKENQSDTDPIQYRLHFKFQTGSEMTFVTMSDDNELKTLDSLYALTPDEINQTGSMRETNALHFAVGFKADEEGCYDNALGLFIMNTETEEDNFIGIIKFKTEVEGEDYRYRTLFTNFGIPDPVLYPNIFKEKDPSEEGTDWRTVNIKSKELFLTYDQIFPYSGTYRALFNAIKFLGYTDLIFKEWYKIKDANDQYRYVAIQNYDSSTGKSIPNAIKKYGVDYTEQDRYLKLNRLSMVYHLQEINENASEEPMKVEGYTFTIGGQKVWIPESYKPYRVALYADKYGTLSGDWENIDIIIARNGNYYCPMLVKEGTSDDPQPDYNKVLLTTSTRTTCRVGRSTSNRCILTQQGETVLSDPFVVIDGTRYPFSYPYDEIPEVENIYEYRSDEVLAKLYSVKKWLEDYITGVNCYISDINGERIVLERIKTIGYVTDGEVKDLTNEGKFTPRCEIRKTKDAEGNTKQDVFTDSSINLTCSLNEFRSVTFEDYADYPIERFIRWKYDRSTRQYGPETVQVKTATSGSTDFQTVPIYVSAPLNALTVADEYQFEVNTDRTDCGSLYEFMDLDSKDNPLVVQDCEIKFWDDKKTVSKITNNVDANSSGKCPIIQINKGNIRRLTDDWSPKSDNNNILWSIYTVTNLDDSNSEDENTYTYMTNVENPELSFTFKGCVNMSPAKTSTDEQAQQSSFIYTTNNKWHLPMMMFKGYSPTNQMRSELQNAEHTAIDSFDKDTEYILEIFEGRILFNNHHNPENEAECESAVIIIAEPEQMPPDEQDIYLKYTFESERKPIYTFDTKAFKTQTQGKTFKTIGDVYTKADDFVSLNTEVNVPVNRLANYSVTVKAYDAYNNTFVNKSDDLCSVTVERPGIEVIVNQVSSDNDPQFYGDNITFNPLEPNDSIHFLDDAEKAELANNMDARPQFPKNYTIYSAEHVVDDATITYENISYAIDTPKKDDYIILTNLTERSEEIVANYADRKITIYMGFNNPGKQNIFNQTNGSVTLCVYDDEYREILAQAIDIPVKAISYSGDKGPSVTVDYFDINETLRNLIPTVNDKTNDINLYVLNTTEVPLESDLTDKYIVIDKEEFITFIPVSDAYANTFLGDTMIKICVNNFSSDNEIAENEVFSDECAYRVLYPETRTFPTGENGQTVEICGYVIEGVFCPQWLEELSNRNIYTRLDEPQWNGTEEMYIYKTRSLNFVMKPLHIVPVQYMLRVNKDARERMYKYSTYFYGSNVQVEYNPRQLLFDSYFDDSYAASISRFEPLDAKQMWRDLSDVITEADADGTPYNFYAYRNFPITVQKNRNVIVRPSSKMPQIRDGYQTLWKWKCYAIEDNSNWREHVANKSENLLFEARNNVLSVSPDMLGPQFVELYCMDVYGNVIANKEGGNIFVDSADEYSKAEIIKKENSK